MDRRALGEQPLGQTGPARHAPRLPRRQESLLEGPPGGRCVERTQPEGRGPGRCGAGVRASACALRVAGLIPGQDTHLSCGLFPRLVRARVGGDQSMFSLPLLPFYSLQTNGKSALRCGLTKRKKGRGRGAVRTRTGENSERLVGTERPRQAHPAALEPCPGEHLAPRSWPPSVPSRAG